MRIDSVDCDYIEQTIRNTYSDITWVSAEIKGTRLIVHIKENDGAKDTSEALMQPRDIVAEKDGVVASIVTRTGTPLVKKGDEVTAGQVLVSGIVPVMNDEGEVSENLYTCADADIMLRVDLPYEEHLSKEYEYKFYTGRKITKWVVDFFNTDVQLGISFKHYEECDVVRETKALKLTDSFYLPVSTGKKEYIEYTTQIRTYSEEEAKIRLNENFTAYLKDLLENEVQIIDESVKIDEIGAEYVASGIVTVNMPAVSYVPEIKGNEENNN
jgi:similar to stage IV sporulation protein